MNGMHQPAAQQKASEFGFRRRWETFMQEADEAAGRAGTHTCRPPAAYPEPRWPLEEIDQFDILAAP